MRKKVKYQTASYPIATLLNIVPLLGSIRGILSYIKKPYNHEILVLLLIFYILIANIIRLSRSSRSIYVSDKKVEYHNMFGLKKSIKSDESIDPQEIRVVHSNLVKATGAKRIINEAKALFNLNHGGVLKYKDKKIFNGMK